MADGHGVELDVVVTAWFTAPEAFVHRPSGLTAPLQVVAGLRPGARKLRCPCLAFVVRHPEAGTIVVDTGFHADAVRAPRREFGALLSVPFRALTPAAEPFDAQLRQRSVDPAAIRQVVMTHLHLDHTSGLRLLPEAEVVCDRREWEAAHRRGAAARGYVAHHLTPVAGRLRLLDVERDGAPADGFAHTVDLLGDGSVVLLSTPGHTPGHLSVLLRLADGGQVLLAGDAVYARASVDDGALPLLTDDDEAYRASVARLRAFAAAKPDVPIVPSHDPGAWRALGA
ncbi:MAG TPA: N-acyl homoserine lactonase family protein [Baekduia sp.]|nr:N-acyl homoserine lactonase family protein [Baekduia sp.]